MPAATRLSLVPSRHMLADAPRMPGVYRSAAMLGGRYVYYVLGRDGTLLDVRRARFHETDADVVAQLDELHAQHTEREVERPTPRGIGAFWRRLRDAEPAPRLLVGPGPRL